MLNLALFRSLDDHEDDANRARYRASDDKETWARISVGELDRCYSSLCFFDAEAMRFICCSAGTGSGGGTEHGLSLGSLAAAP